jgi:uncharacterized protein YjbJ (UPF0337 family)
MFFTSPASLGDRQRDWEPPDTVSGETGAETGARLSGERLAGPRNLPGRPPVDAVSKEAFMDKEHIKGAADKAKGAVKDAAGKVMGDKSMQAEGKMDKAKGDARQAVGDAKDAMKGKI